jgi:hypothetical protein
MIRFAWLRAAPDGDEGGREEPPSPQNGSGVKIHAAPSSKVHAPANRDFTSVSSAILCHEETRMTRESSAIANPDSQTPIALADPNRDSRYADTNPKNTSYGRPRSASVSDVRSRSLANPDSRIPTREPRSRSRTQTATHETAELRGREPGVPFRKCQ